MVGYVKLSPKSLAEKKKMVMRVILNIFIDIINTLASLLKKKTST